MKFLHFSDNMIQPDKNDNNYDRFWKMRTLFDQLNDTILNFIVHLNISYGQSYCALCRESYFQTIQS